MERERISIEEEINNIEENIKVLNKIYYILNNELDVASTKEEKDDRKYKMLAVLYVLGNEEQRKKEYEKFLPKADNISVTPSKDTVKEKLQKHLNILKIYKENSISIEIIIKHGDVNIIKNKFNLKDEDIEFINYLINNYKNIHVNSKKR